MEAAPCRNPYGACVFCGRASPSHALCGACYRSEYGASAVEVLLTSDELAYGIDIGDKRQDWNVERKHKDQAGLKREHGRRRHQEGAVAEFTFSKWSGLVWEPLAFGGDDVGDWQVRGTPYPNGKLLMHHKDPGNRRFALVTGGLSTRQTIRGWIWGRDGKRKDYWQALQKGRPCFCVPQNVLHPFRSCVCV